MSILMLMSDSCTILARSVTAGKIDAESWTAQATPTKCRVLKQAISPRSTANTQRSTVIRTRFALPPTAVIALRDRIQHGQRVYDVIEVTPATDGTGRHSHTVAVCEGIGGGV